MTDSADSRERLARLETQMGNLSESLSEANEAIRALTAAINQMQGGLAAARWVGGIFTAGGIAVVTAAWAVYTWIKGAH